MTAAEVARALQLAPHPEGGYFRELYRSPRSLETRCGRRALSTAISFLVTLDSPSRFHRLSSDELWIYREGEPLDLLTLSAAGTPQGALLGDRLRGSATAGSSPVDSVCVPAGVWQAARLAPSRPCEIQGERLWTLVSCVVSPGFEYEDLELAQRDALAAEFPAHAELIAGLT